MLSRISKLFAHINPTTTARPVIAMTVTVQGTLEGDRSAWSRFWEALPRSLGAISC
jgi:hypothetical protein